MPPMRSHDLSYQSPLISHSVQSQWDQHVVYGILAAILVTIASNENPPMRSHDLAHQSPPTTVPVLELAVATHFAARKQVEKS